MNLIGGAPDECGTVEDLVACAEGRNVTALYTLDSGEYVSYILGAPEFVNEDFRALLADDAPALTPLTMRSDGPATAASVASAVTEPWAACMRGEVVEGFNLVLYEGGSIGDLDACAEDVGLSALYVLDDALLGDISCSNQSLAPNATLTCYGSYTTTNADFLTGLVFQNPRGAILRSGQRSHDVSIVDNDDRSTAVVVSIDRAEVAENAGPTEITVTAELNAGARTVAPNILFQVFAGTATAGTDFAEVGPFWLTIPAHELSATTSFICTPLDDSDVEDLLETVSVTGGSLVDSLSSGVATLGIRDDDRREVAITPTEMALDEGQNRTYTVALTSPPTGTVTVTPSVSLGSGVALVHSTLTFDQNNWATRRSVTVIASPDTDAVDEHVTISHAVRGADYNAVLAPDVIVTVTDDDVPSTLIALHVFPVSVAEGGGDQTIDVIAFLDGASFKVDTTVRLDVLAETATPGEDLAVVESVDSLIPAGSRRSVASFTLSPVNDDVDEGDETIAVTGQVTVDGVPVGSALPVTAATVTTGSQGRSGRAGGIGWSCNRPSGCPTG